MTADTLYSHALQCLGPGERERENRVKPYNLSLHALSRLFFEAGMRQGWLSMEGERKKTLLLAVSGGGDSVAMLWLFRVFYEGELAVAHINHGIRGSDSDGDAAFVRKLSENWGLPFVERQVNVPGERQRGESLETAARRVRQRELLSLADANGAWGIALGHNRDDLAETVLFNLLRGTGVRGAVGIPERRGPFFRPMLGIRRGFLRRILRVRGIAWREDATNEDMDYTRNFIRLELLPLIEKRVNSGAVEHLAAFAGEMRERREDEERRSRVLMDAALAGENEKELVLSRSAMASLSPLERALVLREAGRRAGLPVLSRPRVKELDRLILRKGPFAFQWAGRAVVCGMRGVIQWKKSLL
ncbi:MAG: tRNA lysidine(34) synthetase TilS [Fretibacterium sp.]|nr:tRNA lysidine(34) synthetase TilS [Fretibacterium sp.]